MSKALRIGPFSHFDMEEIEKILRSKALQYSVVVDEAEFKRQENLFKGAGPHLYPTSSFMPKFTFIELSKAEHIRLGDALEKFGVAGASTGEELLAPDAGKHRDRIWVIISKILFLAFLLSLFCLLIYDKISRHFSNR